MKKYEHHSHSHCWNQGGKPACGQPLEKHKQCCLCDMLVPKADKITIQRAAHLGENVFAYVTHGAQGSALTGYCLESELPKIIQQIVINL